MVGWLEQLFCGSLINELGQCEGAVKRYTLLSNDLTQELEELKARCNEDVKTNLQECLAFNEELTSFNMELAARNQKLVSDVQYFQSRMKAFQERLNSAVEIPDIGGYVTNGVTIKPYEHDGLGVINDLLCADLTYLAFPLEDWTAILNLIQPLVERRWVKNISDCDNFALDVVYLVARACRQAGLEYQGAITITWSNTHAYNVFIIPEGTVYVYEPQNGEIIGELGETEKPYDSRKVWFPHEAVS